MKNLLLLEEDLEGRESLARLLKKKGFCVIQAADEAAALTALGSAGSLDLVLAGATNRDRSEFLADLRERDVHLPVIFLADYCGPESRLRGLFGAFSVSRNLNFYINTRPVGLQELERMIRIAMNRRADGCAVPLAAA